MLRTLLVGGAAALVLMTNPAVADGMPRGAPAASVVCCAPNWTGPYIGVGIGGAFATHDRSARDINELNGAVVNPPDYGTITMADPTSSARSL